MSSINLRGKERTLRITIDGARQPGFLKVKNFNHEPMDEIPQQDFVGEDGAEFDYMRDGHTITFDIAEFDRAAHDYLTTLENNFEAGAKPPRVSITVITKYRDGAPTTREHFPGFVMRCTGRNNPGRKEYIGSTWEAKGRKRLPIG